jgi:nitrogen regulatory protein PII-like uncharacterized protein
MANWWITLAFVAHAAMHLLSAVGITWAFIHSYNEHKPSKWKLFMAVVWFILSIALMMTNHEALHHC